MKTVSVAEREMYAARTNMQRAFEVTQQASATMADVKYWMAARMAYDATKAKWA